MQGYRPSAEAIDCKFLPGKVNSTRKLESFAVGFVDGYTKVVIMCGILAMIHDLEPCLHSSFRIQSFFINKLRIVFSARSGQKTNWSTKTFQACS